MNSVKGIYSGWGNFPVLEGVLTTPDSTEDVSAIIRRRQPTIARGNGRSYGDASLGKQMVSTLHWSKIVHFDADAGIIHCESGVLLDRILEETIPQGWFLSVTPGTSQITVGGAIAADVHGKNHPASGCFSNFLIDFQLMLEDGRIVHCSKKQNADLFWLTCGGMGWTGIILSARFQLKKITTTRMLQKTVVAPRLEDILSAFHQHSDMEYGAAWLSGDRAGSGIVFFANHLDGAGELKKAKRQLLNIKWFFPNWVLNNISIRCYNYWYQFRNPAAQKIVELEQFFYPLDQIKHWNKMYGKRGFVQYQPCFSEETASKGIMSILDACQQYRIRPFLSVLKRHGDRPDEAIHSFPIKGYSVALDFPRTKHLPALIEQLDQIVLDLGGKIYLAKDACSMPELSRIDLHLYKSEIFSSALRQRMSNP